MTVKFHSILFITQVLLKQLNKLYRNSSGLTYKELTLPWRMPGDFDSSASKEMCDEGESEMYGIARRYAAKLPEILSYSYSNNNYSFVTTDKLRTAQSAVAFAQGLFEGNRSSFAYEVARRDAILDFKAVIF